MQSRENYNVSTSFTVNSALPTLEELSAKKIQQCWRRKLLRVNWQRSDLGLFCKTKVTTQILKYSQERFANSFSVLLDDLIQKITNIEQQSPFFFGPTDFIVLNLTAKFLAKIKNSNNSLKEKIECLLTHLENVDNILSVGSRGHYFRSEISNLRTLNEVFSLSHRKAAFSLYQTQFTSLFKLLEKNFGADKTNSQLIGLILIDDVFQVIEKEQSHRKFFPVLSDLMVAIASTLESIAKNDVEKIIDLIEHLKIADNRINQLEKDKNSFAHCIDKIELAKSLIGNKPSHSNILFTPR